MEGRERSCHFHWEQSLVTHNKKYVKDTCQIRHKQMCEVWRATKTLRMARAEERKIRKFWRDEAVDEVNIASMDSWLSWWGARFGHWGSISTNDDSIDIMLTPNVNLSESKHGSWKAGEGGKSQVSLYDTCTTDLFNAILQSTRSQAYRDGKYLRT